MPASSASDPKEQGLLDELKEAIVACDADSAKAVAEKIVAAGYDPLRAIEEAIGGAAGEVGAKFDAGEYFLPHLVMAGDAMEAAGDVLQAAVPAGQAQAKKVIVIGTVEADQHSVGKNIVGMMLRSAGFEVHDLGVNVRSAAFIERAKQVNADIIAMSALLTTTLIGQRDVIDALKDQGTRDRFKVIVGGGATTKDWADTIGADGWSANAYDAVNLATKLVS